MVIAVDVPSGLHGDSGEVMGRAPMRRADRHFLPRQARPLFRWRGCERCGAADRGRYRHAASVLRGDRAAPVAERVRAVADSCCSATGLDDHKYARGHLTILGGETATGAARLAALCGAARRRGARRPSPRRARPWPSIRRPSRQSRHGDATTAAAFARLLRGRAAQCDAGRPRLGHQRAHARRGAGGACRASGRSCSTPTPSPSSPRRRQTCSMRSRGRLCSRPMRASSGGCFPILRGCRARSSAPGARPGAAGRQCC